MYGIAIRMTVALVMRENCSEIVGDAVSTTSPVISTPVSTRLRAGIPFSLSFANPGANRPSADAACDDCAAMRIQPTSDPAALRIAATAMTLPAHGPSIFAATSANGACDSCSALLGRMPMITVQQEM